MGSDVPLRHVLLLTAVFPQQRVVRWLKSLQGLSLSPIVFCGRFSDNRLWSYNCDIITYSGSLKIPWSRRRFRSILDYLRNNNVELRLIVCRDIFLANTAAQLSRATGARWILDIADNYPELAMDRTNGPVHRYLLANLLNLVERKACNQADALIFVSDASRELVLGKHRLHGRPRTFVISNLPMREDLRDLSAIHQINPNDSPSQSSTLRCVYIGAYDKRVRDFSPILNAAVRLRNRGIFVQVDIYAKEPESLRPLQESLSEEAKEHLRIFGPIPRTQLNAVLAAYDVGLIPHRRSPATDYTVPNKLYDYVLAGIPFLASDNPSLRSVARNLPYGCFYSPENLDSVVSALANLMEIHSALKERLRHDGARLRDELNWEVAFRRELAACIKDLVGLPE